MPRRSRHGTGGLVFHVFNRGARRLALFATSRDYEQFEGVLAEAGERVTMRLLAYCAMPNHWHLVLWPHEDGDLSRYMAWLTATHAQRWHRVHGTTGDGAVYQGRYKAVAVQDDAHFLTACRYVERNPVRARLARRASQWPWSSRAPVRSGCVRPVLDPWPVLPPRNWEEWVDEPESFAALGEIRRSVATGTPFGSDSWKADVAKRLALPWPRRRPGRPPNG